MSFVSTLSIKFEQIIKIIPTNHYIFFSEYLNNHHPSFGMSIAFNNLA